MKILLDQDISYRLVNKLSSIFSEVQHVKSCNLLDVKDLTIWNYAKTHSYSVVTFDSDFYDFSLLYGHPPKVIWIRTFDQTSTNIEKLLTNFQLSIQQFLQEDDENSCLEILDQH
jgi:predicted nuclease of predicted toxin-antitoxin system